MRVAVGDQVSDWIAPGGRLPTGPFQLNAVFTPDDGTLGTEADLRALAGLTGIKHLNFEQDLKYGDATMEIIQSLTTSSPEGIK